MKYTDVKKDRKKELRENNEGRPPMSPRKKKLLRTALETGIAVLGAAFVVLTHADLYGTDGVAVDGEGRGENGVRLVADLLGHLHAIDLFGRAAGVCQSVFERAVVGQKQKPLRDEVEASDGIYPCLNALQKIGNALASAVVLGGAQIAARLVHYDVYVLAACTCDALAAVCNDVVRRVDDRAKLGGVSVDAHASKADLLLGGTAGHQSRIGHKFLYS